MPDDHERKSDGLTSSLASARSWAAVRIERYGAVMATPEEDYRALLPRLLALYPGLPTIRTKEPFRPVTHVAHGWYMRCHRGVEAVLHLERVGFAEEAAPVRRSILEHVVALKWLAEQGAAVADALRSGAAWDAQKRKDSLVAAGWTSVDLDLFDAVIADTEGIDRGNDNLLHFKPRCDRFGTSHDWATYLIETARSHPCWESAVAYLDITSGTPLAMAEPTDAVDQAGFAAIHLFEALVSINDILKGRPFSPRLAALDREIRSIASRQRRERGLPVPDGFDPGPPRTREPRRGADNYPS